MNYPKCFNNQQQFDKWKHAAQLAREPTNICKDCNRAHSTEMTLQERCHADYWVNITFYQRHEKKTTSSENEPETLA